MLFTPTPASRWPLETTAAGFLASVSPAQVLWETASPATVFSPCQHPTAERSVLAAEHRALRGGPTRSWGPAAETATAFRAELSRLRRTPCNSPLRQQEPWPPRRRTWQPPQPQTRPRQLRRPPLRLPRLCWCTESRCTTGRLLRAPSRRGLPSSSTTRCSVTFIFWLAKEWVYREYQRTGKMINLSTSAQTSIQIQPEGPSSALYFFFSLSSFVVVVVVGAVR